ncbi:MAG: hypothetical protein PF689_04145 [Deltaproteobacteria bacterium]|jgi:biopolymer transport protein ExbB/TolQ|nr:hypothetical protein [Deltaproteobacteria bacterium]
MDTTVWSFLIVVVIVSLIGYYILKKYSIHYANKKTDKIINKFLKENELETEKKSFEEIEKSLMEKEKSESESESESKKTESTEQNNKK